MGGSKTESSASPIPPWMKKNYQKLVKEGGSWAFNAPIPTAGAEFGDYRIPSVEERIAAYSPSQILGEQARTGMFQSGDRYRDMASGGLGMASESLAGMKPIASNYKAGNFDFLTGYGADDISRFMNPYTENVLDVQKRRAREDFERDMNRSQAENVSRGALIGNRRARMEDREDRDLFRRQLDDMESKGRHDAFLAASGLLDKERGAMMKQQELRDLALRSQGEMGLRGQVEEAGRLGRMAQTYSDLGMRYSEMDDKVQGRELARIKAMEEGGARDQAMRQSIADLNMEEAMKAYYHPREQMSWLGSLMAGVPTQPNAYTRSPGPNLGSGLAGAGMLLSSLGKQALG